MGIPHYFQVIADKYPLIVTNNVPKNIDDISYIVVPIIEYFVFMSISFSK